MSVFYTPCPVSDHPSTKKPYGQKQLTDLMGPFFLLHSLSPQFKVAPLSSKPPWFFNLDIS